MVTKRPPQSNPAASISGPFLQDIASAIQMSHGGILPTNPPRFSVKAIAFFVKRDEKTVRDWLKKYQVPCKKWGDEPYFTADDFIDCVPDFVFPSPSPEDSTND